MKFIRTCLIYIGLISVIYFSTDNMRACHNTMKMNHELIETERKINLLTDSAEIVRDSLTLEVQKYIDKSAPKSKMTAEHIVGMCEEHDFDITLLLTQGHLETHFGQTNPRNNVFGLYKKRYEHPDSAVIDYINLMKRRYVSKRSTEDALKANMNVEGSSKYFYSENKQYCQHLTKIRNRILKTTSIETLFDNLCIINREIESLRN